LNSGLSIYSLILYILLKIKKRIKITISILENITVLLNKSLAINPCGYSDNRLSYINNIRISKIFINSFGYLPKMKTYNKQLKSYHSLTLNLKKVREEKDNLSFDTNTKTKLNPYFVTGLTDAEGCFLINVRPNPQMKTGYSIELVFKLALISHDKELLEKFRDYFGIGTLTLIRSNDCILY